VVYIIIIFIINISLIIIQEQKEISIEAKWQLTPKLLRIMIIECNFTILNLTNVNVSNVILTF